MQEKIKVFFLDLSKESRPGYYRLDIFLVVEMIMMILIAFTLRMGRGNFSGIDLDYYILSISLIFNIWITNLMCRIMLTKRGAIVVLLLLSIFDILKFMVW